MTTDGAVKAMVGGRSYVSSEFNRATQAKRQPGSAFKPFVFLAALEAGQTPATKVVDAEVTYRGWTPANFSQKHEGEMTMAEALAKSVNTVAVKLCLEVGPETVARAARRMGIVSDLAPVPSLGAWDVGGDACPNWSRPMCRSRRAGGRRSRTASSAW